MSESVSVCVQAARGRRRRGRWARSRPSKKRAVSSLGLVLNQVDRVFLGPQLSSLPVSVSSLAGPIRRSLALMLILPLVPQTSEREELVTRTSFLYFKMPFLKCDARKITCGRALEASVTGSALVS